MIFASNALLDSGWVKNVRITLTGSVISTITIDTQPQAPDVRVDTLLPALSNLHSHSFQRAMAGMTEFRSTSHDSFWTWRSLMYRFVNHITPAQFEAIAALVFMEMLEAGYAAVGEFHYVHHQRNGVRFSNPAELSLQIFAAAALTGIGLTHLPVLYSYGGANQLPLAQEQLRFGNNLEEFLTLVEHVRAGISTLPDDSVMGYAPHSLRATRPEDLHQLIKIAGDAPIHIHAAEQLKEVEEIHTWLGARPVAWLLHNFNVSENWCLVHATHLTNEETLRLAGSKAVVGLCPITEANLGDGPFNGPCYLNAKGRFGIGSDSNVNISLTEELRSLEYSQRLRDMSRNVMVVGEGSVGQTLYVKAAQGGAQALGRKAGKISVGYLADLVAIDAQTPALCALHPNQLLDGLVFAAKDSVITDVWSAGRHNVKNGQHLQHELIVKNYKTAIKDLLGAL